MKKDKKRTSLLMKCLDAVALLLVIQTVNSACIWHFHQPEIPDDAFSYRRAELS